MHLNKLTFFLQQYFPIIFLGGMLLFAEAYSQYSRTHYHRTKQQRDAQHPKVAQRWLQKRPKGIVIGKAGGKYFCIPESRDLLNLICLGGSGSGKSSGPLACTILQNHVDQGFTYLTIDIKGELHRLLPSGSYLLIDPTDREHSVGWDPYFRLHERENQPDDLQIEVFTGIARSLIPSNEKDKYFSENAIAMLSGLLAYGFSKGETICDTIGWILTTSISERIKKISEEANPMDVCMFFLGKFVGKTSEGFEDIISTMTTSLSCFSLQEVQYIFRDNPMRIGMDAVRKNNIFLSVPDNLLTESQFSPIFRLIIEQQLTYLTLKLPEKGQRPVGILIDEFYALGKLSVIKHQLSICRGYGVFIALFTQSLAGIEELYGKEGARVITENTRIKVILECTDTTTSQMIVDWSGTYHERMNSHNTGRRAGSGGISWQVKNVFDKSDFADLVERNRIIVISPSGMNQINKVQWFRTTHFKRIHKVLNKEELS